MHPSDCGGKQITLSPPSFFGRFINISIVGLLKKQTVLSKGFWRGHGHEQCFQSHHWDMESNLESCLSDLHGLLPTASAKALIRTMPKLKLALLYSRGFSKLHMVSKWSYKVGAQMPSTWEGMENSIPSHLSLPENNFTLVISSIYKTLLAV